jgi:hypothetical protein
MTLSTAKGVFAAAISLSCIATPYAALAKFGTFSIGSVHVRLDKPLNPVQVDPVTVAPGLTITPPVPSVIPTPSVVHVEGNGVIAQTVDGANTLEQVPKAAADDMITKAGEGVSHFGGEVGKTVSHMAEELGKSFKDPFGLKKWGKERSDEWRNIINDPNADWRIWVDRILSQMTLWAIAGFAAVILVSVLISSLVTSLIMRKSLVSAIREAQSPKA